MFPVFPVLFPVCSQFMCLRINDVPSVPTLGRARVRMRVQCRPDFLYRFPAYWEYWEQGEQGYEINSLQLFPVLSDGGNTGNKLVLIRASVTC